MVLLLQKADKSDTTMLMSVILLQPLKASQPIVDRLPPTDKEVKLLQSTKASVPIDVTLAGRVIEVKPVQPEKADSSMDVTLLGMVTEVSWGQGANIEQIHT